MEDFEQLHRAIEYDGDGAGTAVLFVHGICGSPRIFGPMIEDFASAGYAASALLLPGHGSTSRDFASARRADWTLCVHKEARRLKKKHDRLIIIGHSMGGLLAVREGVFHGGVDGMVLINTPLVLHMSVQQVSLGAKTFLGLEGKNERDREYAETFAVKVENPVSTVTWLPRVVDLFTLMKETRELLPGLSCPALVIQSAQDETVSPKSADFLRDNLTCCERVVLLKDSMHSYFSHSDYELMEHSALWFAGRHGDREKPAPVARPGAAPSGREEKHTRKTT